MKKIYFLFSVLLSFRVLSQVPCPEEQPYAEWAYGVLKPLDKSQFLSGVLYENVFPLANIFDKYFVHLIICKSPEQ